MVAASAIAHRDTKTTNDKPQPSLLLSLPLRRSLVIKEDMLSICYFCLFENNMKLLIYFMEKSDFFPLGSFLARPLYTKGFL